MRLRPGLVCAAPLALKTADFKTAARVMTDALALKTAAFAMADVRMRSCALALKSPAISQPPQVCFDGLLQFRGLGELGVQFGDEARHLFLERIAVVFHFLGADVAAGRKDVAVRGDFGGGGGFAEAGDVA